MTNIEKWDRRFLELATLIGNWSKGPTVKVGALIVDKNKRIISTGFCGFAKNVEDTEERYLNRDIKLKLGIHAETNAILFAKKDLTECTIYCTHITCSSCASNIIQTGITRVVAQSLDIAFYERWKDDIELAFQIYKEADVRVTLYKDNEVIYV
jgi:dCMP deaminase